MGDSSILLSSSTLFLNLNNKKLRSDILKTKPDVLQEFAVEDRIDIKLHENSTHFLTGEIEEYNITQTIKWIISENLDTSNDSPLTLYVNSIGGDLYQAFALVDVIKSSRRPVQTVGVGTIMSSGFLIFISGAKGLRKVSKNTGIMCHQYSEGRGGKHHDLKASMKEGDTCDARMLEIIKEGTGLPTAKVKSKLLTKSDVFLTAEELIALGGADSIL